jgi:hypothetical protein
LQYIWDNSWKNAEFTGTSIWMAWNKNHTAGGQNIVFAKEQIESKQNEEQKYRKPWNKTRQQKRTRLV